MLEKYRKIIESCRPYAVINSQVRPHCNLKPLGLEIPEDSLVSPFTRATDDFIDALQWLDRMTFGFVGMVMPRWVFYDCSVMPGGICGLTVPFEALPPSLVRGVAANRERRGPWPVSMAITIPLVPEGAWLKHTLCSINELSHLAAPPGLRTITFALAMSLFDVKTLYSTVQWRSSELRVHLKFSDLELVTAYTPAHTEPRTLTYRFDVTPESLMRGLSGREAYIPEPADASYLDADDVEGMIQLQRRIETGERLFVCGRPIRDGSTTWVPIRAEA